MLLSIRGSLFDSHQHHAPCSEFQSRLFGKLPKLDFPAFDGKNPKLWISRCETYFDMYQVDPEVWVRIVSMHLSPTVACWFESVERKFPALHWALLYQLLVERYGKDQYQSLLRQLFRIRQTSSVSDYVEHFSTLVDRLAAYGTITDPLYFTTQFVDGLCVDIRAVILIQHPLDLDSACSLALLQEEVTESMHRKEHRKAEFVP